MARGVRGRRRYARGGARRNSGHGQLVRFVSLRPGELEESESIAARKWRAAAVDWACNRFGVPVIVLKSVTDIVEHAEDGASEFTQNLWGKALETLSAAMPRVLSAVVGVMA